MERQVRTPNGIVAIKCCDDTCETVYGNCEYAKRTGRASFVCALFRIRLEVEADGLHPFRAGICRRNEIAPPATIGGNGFGFGGSGGSIW